MTELTLADLGWSDHFARQVPDGSPLTPARITEVQRAAIAVLTTDGPQSLTTPDQTGAYAVGDWVLSDGTTALQRLDRTTEIARRAAGHDVVRQLIAANVDTLGIVTSCNADFNVARLERYLALALAGGCVPLVILTRADTVTDAGDYVRQAQRLSPLVTALALNAKDVDDAARLAAWCGPGQTLAFVGSSGVGKTTLQNALTGLSEATRDARADDAKGRHTTTYRALRRTLAGGWLIDTPGMRELQLSDAAEGIDSVFSDIVELAARCRFADCAHETEPGCAITAAIAAGELERARLERWKKLMREDGYNSETIAESRARFRKLGKVHRGGKAMGRHKRGKD